MKLQVLFQLFFFAPAGRSYSGQCPAGCLRKEKVSFDIQLQKNAAALGT